MLSAYTMRYGSPETRKLTTCEDGQCPACERVGGVPEGAVIFIVVEDVGSDDREIRRIEGLGSLFGASVNGCVEVTAEEADAIAAEVRDEMQAAVDFGLASPWPAAEDAVKYVYA